MRFTSVSLGAVLAATASAKPLGLFVNRDAASVAPLEVQLSSTGNSAIKASIKNNGAENLNLLRRGTILDDLDIEKIRVSGGGQRIGFQGIMVALQHDNIPAGAFMAIQAGETIEIDLESASLHDLSSGGQFEVQAKGIIPIAKENSTILTGGGIPFESNTLTLTVDGAEAARTFKSHASKLRRGTIPDNCQGEQRTQVEAAFADCARLSAQSADFIRNGDAAKVEEYFKASDADTRTYVADRFDKLAAVCSTTNEGVNAHCTTPEPCADGVLAFAIVGGMDTYYCPGYFGLPQLAECHIDDKMGVTLHEFTHSSVLDPACGDYAYWYDNLIQLSPEEAKNNADTYAFFANAMQNSC